MSRVHKIDARLACWVVEELRRHKEPIDGLLKDARLRRVDVADPEARIRYSAVLRLIERAADALGDASLGLRLGASHEAGDHGMIGFIALNSPTLRDALSNIRRYFQVLGEGEDIELVRHGPHVALRFRETDPNLRGLRHNSDYIAASIVRICRQITQRQRLAPLSAEFVHRRPKQEIDYQRYLGCAPKFGAEWDAVVFTNEALQLPVIRADNKLLRVLENACRKVLGPAPRKDDIVYDVRELITDGLARGTAQFDVVARELNMSSKTLERRLTERDTNFSTLLDDIRCNLAKWYLEKTDLRLEQFVYLLGYAETPTLVRAFRRWTGMTPIRYRLSTRRELGR
jgi:AraC-like DNA-binding protein